VDSHHLVLLSDGIRYTAPGLRPDPVIRSSAAAARTAGPSPAPAVTEHWERDVDAGSATSLPNSPSRASIQLRVRCCAEPYGVNNSDDYPDKPETYHMVVFGREPHAGSSEMEDEAAQPPPGLSPARPAPSFGHNFSLARSNRLLACRLGHPPRQHRWQ
jgi:hypothetical protein